MRTRVVKSGNSHDMFSERTPRAHEARRSPRPPEADRDRDACTCIGVCNGTYERYTLLHASRGIDVGRLKAEGCGWMVDGGW